MEKTTTFNFSNITNFKGLFNKDEKKLIKGFDHLVELDLTKISKNDEKLKTMLACRFISNELNDTENKIELQKETLNKCLRKVRELELKRGKVLDEEQLIIDLSKAQISYDKALESLGKLDSKHDALLSLSNRLNHSVIITQKFFTSCTQEEKNIFNLLYADVFKESENINVLNKLIKASQEYWSAKKIGNDKEQYLTLKQELVNFSDRFKITKNSNSQVFENKIINFNSKELEAVANTLGRSTIVMVKGNYAFAHESDKNISNLAMRLVIGKWQGVKFE